MVSVDQVSLQHTRSEVLAAWESKKIHNETRVDVCPFDCVSFERAVSFEGT